LKRNTGSDLSVEKEQRLGRLQRFRARWVTGRLLDINNTVVALLHAKAVQRDDAERWW